MGEKRIRNTAEYIAHCTKVHNGKFGYNDTHFNGNYNLITFECPIHGIIDDMTARAHKEKGCKYCNGWVLAYTTEQVSEILNKRYPNYTFFNLPNPLINGVKTMFLPECNIHGLFPKPVILSSLLTKNGRDCPACANVNRGQKNALTREKYISQALENPRNKNNDYSILIYINRDTDINFICPIHGIQKQNPTRHKKIGCRGCYEKRVPKHNYGTYIKKAREINGYTYDYSKVPPDFSGLNGKKIELGCPKHGWFLVDAAAHIIDGRGCVNCNGGVLCSHDDFVSKANIRHGQFKYISQYINSHVNIDIECPKHGLFPQLPYVHLQSPYGCPHCAAESQQSIGENEVADYIASIYKGEIKRNVKMLDEKHIDIYLPEIKFGVEFCGLHWHNEDKGKHRKYHIGKTNLANEQGVRLVQIYDKEWLERREIVKSRISSILNHNTIIIPARKTAIINLNKDQKRNFLNRTHMQGNVASQLNYGLLYDDQLVACMTFGYPRFKSKCEWELIRYSSELYTHVIGGASKLLSHFRKEYSGSIVSFADRRWSNGSLYFKLGFKLDGITEPGYHYYNDSNKKLYNRITFQKHKLKKMPHYDKNLSEYDIMKANKCYRVWDCGEMRFVLI